MSEQPGAPGADAGAAGAAPMSERMQALLSRAVEDQLTEQRQLASLVAEVRALLAALPSEVAAAAQGDEVLRAEATRMRTGLTAVEQRLEVLTALAQRPVDHSEVTTSVGSVGQRVGALEQALSRIETRLAELAAKVQAQAAAAQESEQRIVSHVDEAVLALAEVLVRKSRPSSLGAVKPPAAPAAQIAPVEIPAATPAEPVVAPDPTPPDTAVDIAVVAGDEPAEANDEVEDALADVDAAEGEAVVDDDEDDDEYDEDEPDDDLDDEDDEDEDDDEDDEDDEDAAAPAAERDPWAVSSPFQPGPPRERVETGAAAALAELQAGETAGADDAEPAERARRKPWWRPGD